MKKIFTILTTVLLTASVFSQSPEKMSYQAVIRNSSNALVVSHIVGMRISILQGSPTGTEVYSETQTPSTNSNGLISIEIGNGAGFATINWATGIYFIKTETDPSGGTNYTISGTSQLLSVPYSLNAKNAETADYNNLTNLPVLNIANWDSAYGWGNHTTMGYLTNFTETDPIFSTHPANGISATNITDWNTAYGWGNHAGLYHPISWVPSWTDITDKPTFASVATSGSYDDLSNKPTTDGSETKINSGTNINVTGTGTTASPYVVNATIHYIGESYGGGIVFWVDATGQHGLIAATTDQSIGMPWYNGTYRFTGTTGDGLYTGAMNTAMIVATQLADNQTGNFAAKVCADYSIAVGGITYGDWYLPSKYELNLLYLQKAVVGGLANSFYWSSTEGSSDNLARIQLFIDGTQYFTNKNSPYYVRAVRAF